MDDFDKFAKILLTVLMVAVIWAVIMTTITSFHDMRIEESRMEVEAEHDNH